MRKLVRAARTYAGRPHGASGEVPKCETETARALEAQHVEQVRAFSSPGLDEEKYWWQRRTVLTAHAQFS